MARTLMMIAILLTLGACSTTVKGPITKKQYKLDVGCTDDMEAYRKLREQAVKVDNPEPEAPPGDCPTDEASQPGAELSR